MELCTASIDATSSLDPVLLPGTDSPETLILCFGCPRLMDRPEILTALAARYPASHLLGCSTSGEIFGNEVRDDSMSLAIARFEKTRLAHAYAPVFGVDDSCRAGEQIARELMAEELRGVLVLSDGTSVNGSELVRGLNQVLPAHVTVTGGLAGDAAEFKRTWVLQEGNPVEHVVSAIGFYGDHIQIGHGSKGGWDPFGPERLITRSKGNILYELDHKPALKIYEDYLGEKASGLPGTALLFPLCVREDRFCEDRATRTVLSVSKVDQSMTFAGDMPEGHLARLMKCNFERLVEAASLAAGDARTGNGVVRDVLSIAISCVGRRLILGERTEDELEAAMESLPQGTQQVGFYSYGEISPHARGSTCDLHNQTMTLTTISEA